MTEEKKGKQPVGRPPQTVEPIPDTFENVVRALVQSEPEQKPAKPSR